MRALIFDTETTDLLSPSAAPLKLQPHIMEFFGHIVEDDGTVIEELEFRCNPGVPIPEKVQKITRITDADVSHLPPFKEFSGQVLRIIANAEAVVAHNLSYDFQVVTHEFTRIDPSLRIKWPLKRICTVQETEALKGKRLTLTDLHTHLFGEAFKDAHSARADVMALTRCWVELRKMEMV